MYIYYSASDTIARQKRYCTSEAFQTVPPDSSPPFSTAIKFDRSKSLDWLSKPLNTTSDGHMFPQIPVRLLVFKRHTQAQ